MCTCVWLLSHLSYSVHAGLTPSHIHCGVEVTELSTNKQHTLSSERMTYHVRIGDMHNFEMHSHICLHTDELRETKERLNERLSDDEVTQIQFRAGQDDLENVKQQLRDVEAKLADRSKECEALERKAALQVHPRSLLPVLPITDARDCSALVFPSPHPER